MTIKLLLVILALALSMVTIRGQGDHRPRERICRGALEQTAFGWLYGRVRQPIKFSVLSAISRPARSAFKIKLSFTGAGA